MEVSAKAMADRTNVGLAATTMDFPLTLEHLFEHGTRLFGDQQIVTGVGPSRHCYTYADFRQRVRRLADALRTWGVRPGDRVASFAWNTYRLLELYFAVPLVGAVLHTVNFRLFPDQIAYVVNHAEDRLIFVDTSLLPILEPVRHRLSTIEHSVTMENGAIAERREWALDYEELLESGNADRDPFVRVPETAAAALCYTSGTTGNPKGVAYSHRALTLHAFMECMTDTLRVSHRSTVLGLASMFHANGWGLPHSCTLVGAKQVFPGPHPTPSTILQTLVDEKVTTAAGIPTQLTTLLAEIERTGVRPPALQYVFAAGAAVPASLIAAYDRLGIAVVQAWGMTETAPVGTLAWLKPSLEERPIVEQVAKRATVGYAMPGVETRVVGDDGHEVPSDGKTIGELQVRGPWVTGSYFKEPNRTDSFTDDGWLRSGDLAVVDGDGYVNLVDRAKDIIKSGGEWISSVALESALICHPKVFEAAVIGVADPKWSERPLAFAVARPECAGQISEAELRDFLQPQFPKWWLPDHFVFVDAIPKTSVGKFDKKVLRQRVAEGVVTWT